MQPKHHSLGRNLLPWTIPRSLYSKTLVLDLSRLRASWREVGSGLHRKEGPLKVCPFLHSRSFITFSSISSPVPPWPCLYSQGGLFSEQLISVFSSVRFFKTFQESFTATLDNLLLDFEALVIGKAWKQFYITCSQSSVKFFSPRRIQDT